MRLSLTNSLQIFITGVHKNLLRKPLGDQDAKKSVSVMKKLGNFDDNIDLFLLQDFIYAHKTWLKDSEWIACEMDEVCREIYGILTSVC
jgi:hypothetical protein